MPRVLVSAMHKTIEYISFEFPIVPFDLRETKVSAVSPGAYVLPKGVRGYAEAIVDLVDDDSARAQPGKVSGRRAGANSRGSTKSRLAFADTNG